MKINYIYKENITTLDNNSTNGMWYTTITI